MFNRIDGFHHTNGIYRQPDVRAHETPAPSLPPTTSTFSDEINPATAGASKRMPVTYEETRPYLEHLPISDAAKREIFNSLVLLGNLLADKAFGELPEQKILLSNERNSVRNSANRVFSAGYPKNHFDKAARGSPTRLPEDS